MGISLKTESTSRGGPTLDSYFRDFDTGRATSGGGAFPQ
jgi:hypothetical protein